MKYNGKLICNQEPEADKRKMLLKKKVKSSNGLEYQPSTITFLSNISVILPQLPKDQQDSR